MKKNPAPPETIDDYIAGFPPPVRDHLKKIRATIHRAAPKATEAIKYQLPTFVLGGNLVHFGAFKHHIGFYPSSSGTSEFAKELKAYEGSKGAVRFPLDQPMPLSLIARIVKFRVVENSARIASKRK